MQKNSEYNLLEAKLVGISNTCEKHLSQAAEQVSTKLPCQDRYEVVHTDVVLLTTDTSFTSVVLCYYAPAKNMSLLSESSNTLLRSAESWSGHGAL